jgi:transcriptional regulator of acetoin/glycerol metabolism
VVRAAAMCDGIIRVQDLPERIREYRVEQLPTNVEALADASEQDWPQLSEIEGRYVARVLQHTAGNKQAASRVLGVDRKTLDRMIKRHHIDVHRRSDRDQAVSKPEVA